MSILAEPGGSQGGTGSVGAGGADPPDKDPASGGAGGNANPCLEYLPESFRADAVFSRFKDMESLLASYKSAQSMVGMDKIPIPGKHATDDDWKQVFGRLGLPESVDKYEMKLPEGVDADFVKAFKETAHKAGVLPKQAQ